MLNLCDLISLIGLIKKLHNSCCKLNQIRTNVATNLKVFFQSVKFNIMNLFNVSEEVKVKVGLSGPPPMKSGFQYVNPAQEDQMVGLDITLEPV